MNTTATGTTLLAALVRNLAWTPKGSEGEAKKEARHLDLLEQLPHGSGIDDNVTVVGGESGLVITLDWHHMSDLGYYTGWYVAGLVVTPSLAYGLEIEGAWVGSPPEDGFDGEDILDYLAETFTHALGQPAE